MITIHAISDLHGYEIDLPGGDLLVIAGDCTARDIPHQWKHFADWVNELDYSSIVLVGGNHDGALQEYREETLARFGPNVHYLQDEEKTIEGLRIYGSPWTPLFCDWHFMKHPVQMYDVWDKVPPFLDVLVTHGPPKGILDKCDTGRAGDDALAMSMRSIQPAIHIFGHIHEGHGHDADLWFPHENITKYYNVAICDEEYRATRPHTVIHYEPNIEPNRMSNGCGRPKVRRNSDVHR